MFQNSLVAQNLGLWTLTAKGLGSIPGQGTKIPQATQHGTPKKDLFHITKRNFLNFIFLENFLCGPF